MVKLDSPTKVRICQFCGKGIATKKANAIYCSQSCRSMSFRTKHILDDQHRQVSKHIMVICRGLSSPDWQAATIDKLITIRSEIEKILKSGFQPMLPTIGEEDGTVSESNNGMDGAGQGNHEPDAPKGNRKTKVPTQSDGAAAVGNRPPNRSKKTPARKSPGISGVSKKHRSNSK